MTELLFAENTKGRILKESLGLFNEQSFSQVTTAQIAAAASIREGNLWYHFKTKRDLALSHLDTLEQKLSKHLEEPLNTSMNEMVDHFINLIQLLWDFRYIMRDHIPVLDEDADGAARLQRLFAAVEQRVQTRLLAGKEEGLLDIKEDEIERVSVNAILIARYWFDYVRARHGNQALTKGASDAGMLQLGSLIKPYLTSEGRKILKQIIPEAG